MLSIIIVAMGESEVLKGCLASVKSHVSLPHEVILVNNSPNPLSSFSDSVQCLENGTNMGFARAVNRGIREARGDKILLLNPDACFTSDIASEMSRFLDENTKAGIVGPQLVFPDNSLQNSIDVIPNLATEVLNKSLLKILFPKFYPSKRSGFSEPVQVPSVIGACMMIRREVIEKVGPLDEGFFLYLEETDFCRRTVNAGFDVWHLPHLQITHLQGESAHKTDIRRKIEYQRSMYRFFRKGKGQIANLLLPLFTLVKLIVEVTANAPIALFTRGKTRQRLKRSWALLLWHLAGMPASWGLEKVRPEYRKVRRNGFTWFVEPGAEIPDEASNPARFMETACSAVLNSSKTTYVKSGLLGSKPVFVKRYNFKGTKDTLKNLFRKSRAMRSFEGSIMLRQCGVSTPKVVFACERRVCGVLLESYVATEGIEAKDLVAFVAEQGYGRELIASVASFIRRLHEMGFMPVDLKGENLLKTQGAVFLIDLDRLKRVKHPAFIAIAKNLSYLNASFCTTVPVSSRRFFLDEYTKGNGLLEEKRGALCSRIEELTAKRLEERYSQ